MFGKIKTRDSGEYHLKDIQGLIDKTERYRDLIRTYVDYVSILENVDTSSVENKTARLRLRDKLRYVGARDDYFARNGFGFHRSELEEIAAKTDKFLTGSEE